MTLLAIDIGNTTSKFALIQRKTIIRTFQIFTRKNLRQMKGDVIQLLKRIPPPYREEIATVIICSVVPRAEKVVESVLQHRFKKEILVVGRDVKVPIINRYRNPHQVGQDRLVGAFAALRLYGAPLIIIDLGTAITIDVVSKKGEYQGGIIVPGISLSAETLNQKTALLPKVKIAKPRSVIGRDTRSSILSGIFYGYGQMLSGLVRLISQTHAMEPNVILTGGHVQLMKDFLSLKHCVIDQQLISQGLQMICAQRGA
jgi:type III pantothenate kinase